MERRGLVALVCALILLAGSCGRQQPAAGSESESRVVRTVELTDSMLLCGGADTLFLGRLFEGEQARVRLQLRNATNHPLVVLQHELTCGCIALEYDRRPIMPSKALDLQVDFDTRGLYGWQLKLFRLRLTGSGEPLRIYVDAEVE